MLSTNRPIVAAVVAAFLVRLVALLLARDAELVLDEKTYALRAEALLDGQGFVGSYQSWVRHAYDEPVDLPQYPGAWQPPGYTAFIAGIYALTGRSAFAVKLAQVVLGTISVLWLYQLGRRWFGEQAGLAAAWIAAFYPNLVAYTHYLFSETLFTFLLLGSLVVLTRNESRLPVRNATAAGALLGLAALTRAALVYFLPVLAAWILWRWRDRWRAVLPAALVVLFTAALVILPWTVRNTLLHDGFVLIETNGPYNLWRGNGPGAFEQRCSPQTKRYPFPFACLPISPVGNRYAWILIDGAKRDLGEDQPTDLEIVRYAKSEAWREIKGDPGTFLRRMIPRTIDMWNPTSFLVRHVVMGAYGPMAPAVAWILVLSAMATYAAAALLALTGLWVERRNPHTYLILLLALFYTAISAVSFGLTRFRLPLEPLLLLLAGAALLAWLRPASNASYDPRPAG